MLPLSHRQVYQTWLNHLQLLHEQVSQGDLSNPATFEQVQRYFYQEVMSLKEEGIAGELASRWRSLQTELHRLVRLLETDWLFCRSSRQRTTTEQRLKGLRERLDKIEEYCQVLVQERLR